MTDSFLEIAPGGIVIPISGKQIETHGLPLRSIAGILTQYPALIELMFGNRDAANTKNNKKKLSINPADIAKAAPEAVIDIILHGIRMPNNKKAREIAENLPSGEQLVMLSTIIKLSIGSGGLGPLVECLEELVAMGGPLMAMTGEGQDATASQQVTNSPLQ